MDRDLRGNVLPFWIREVVDEAQGGFLGYLSDEGVPDPLAPKGGVLCARILWTYAAALSREAKYKDAFSYLIKAQGINRAETARLIEKDPRFDLLLEVDPRMEPLLLGPSTPPTRTAPAGNAPLIFSLPPSS